MDMIAVVAATAIVGIVGLLIGVLLGVPIASVIYALVMDWLDNRPDAPLFRKRRGGDGKADS